MNNAAATGDVTDRAAQIMSGAAGSFWRLSAIAGCLCAFVCSAFTLSASFFLLFVTQLYPDLIGKELGAGLWLRSTLFAALTLISALGVAALRQPRGSRTEASAVSGHGCAVGLSAVLFFAGMLVLPNLSAYPWAAPDEMHHLIVAKNLALHGKYASGDPEAGFRMFDPYDSVGAPVIVPVAAVFRFFGVSVAGARYVIAVYFLVLLLGFYALARSIWGGGAAVAGVLFVVMAFSSVYLGRTLYGEAPALCYLVWGLLLWRRSLATRSWNAWGVSAGVVFGAAVLSKTVFVFFVFPLLGVLLYDRLNYRRIGIRHVLLPIVGVVLMLTAWWACQTLASGDVAETAGGTLGLYRHYLLFGFSPAWNNLWKSVFAYPWAHAVLFVAVIASVRTVFDQQYDPATVALWLLAAFFAYWWVFFTPGQLPRYLWPSYAIAAISVGALFWCMVRAGVRRETAPMRRAGAWIAAVSLAAPSVAWISGQAREVYFNREMRDDYAVAMLVQRAPAGAGIATNFYPMRQTLRFLADRQVTIGEDFSALPFEADVVVTRAPADSFKAEASFSTCHVIGPYLVLSRNLRLE